jgi:hypothetical protein
MTRFAEFPQRRQDANVVEHAFDINDITYAYAWDKSDYTMLRKRYDMIKLLDRRRAYGEKRKLIADFETKLERRRNDQTAFDEMTNEYLDPLNIIEKVDRVTNAGRTRAAELIAGESGYRFDHAAVGTSKLPVFDSDYQLGAEFNRINIRDNGYVSAAGAVIKHSGLWAPGLASVTIWEFCAVDLPVPDLLQMIWCRVVFPENSPLVHVQNEMFFTITHSAYTSSTV